MPPLGVILAGGLGARIGGAKAVVELAGKPLIQYPCEALKAALGEVVVIAKADTELPGLTGVTVWVEPQAPRHPLIGLMHALDLAEGRPVLSCPVDLPFVTAEVIRRFAEEDPGDAPAVVASAGGVVQPLLGCYQPQARERLRSAGFGPDVPVRRAIAAIAARQLDVDPQVLFNVNSPDDLLQAAAMLDRAKPPRNLTPGAAD
jgi:molybdopterin-guanine dinucleotide biosynthesis protein A